MIEFQIIETPKTNTKSFKSIMMRKVNVLKFSNEWIQFNQKLYGEFWTFYKRANQNSNRSDTFYEKVLQTDRQIGDQITSTQSVSTDIVACNVNYEYAGTQTFVS